MRSNTLPTKLDESEQNLMKKLRTNAEKEDRDDEAH
jgi:hypothetical protein